MLIDGDQFEALACRNGWEYYDTHNLRVSPKKIILSHNSDISLSHVDVPSSSFLFLQNYNGSAPNIMALPIGLERVRWYPYKRDILEEVKLMNIDIEFDFYLNFSTQTNPKRKGYYQKFSGPRSLVKYGSNGVDYRNYLIDIKRSRFTVSPEGNGIDCHRTWESIYMGRCPIIESSMFADNVYGMYSSFDGPYVEFDYSNMICLEYWERKMQIALSNYFSV